MNRENIPHERQQLYENLIKKSIYCFMVFECIEKKFEYSIYGALYCVYQTYNRKYIIYHCFKRRIFAVSDAVWLIFSIKNT